MCSAKNRQLLEYRRKEFSPWNYPGGYSGYVILVETTGPGCSGRTGSRMKVFLYSDRFCK